MFFDFGETREANMSFFVRVIKENARSASNAIDDDLHFKFLLLECRNAKHNITHCGVCRLQSGSSTGHHDQGILHH